MANLSRHVAIAGLAGLLAACAASSTEWQERLTVLPALFTPAAAWRRERHHCPRTTP